MMEVQSLSEEGLGKLPLVARLIPRHVHVNSAKIFRDENYLSLNNSQRLEIKSLLVGVSKLLINWCLVFAATSVNPILSCQAKVPILTLPEIFLLPFFCLDSINSLQKQCTKINLHTNISSLETPTKRFLISSLQAGNILLHFLYLCISMVISLNMSLIHLRRWWPYGKAKVTFFKMNTKLKQTIQYSQTFFLKVFSMHWGRTLSVFSMCWRDQNCVEVR